MSSSKTIDTGYVNSFRMQGCERTRSRWPATTPQRRPRSHAAANLGTRAPCGPHQRSAPRGDAQPPQGTEGEAHDPAQLAHPRGGAAGLPLGLDHRRGPARRDDGHRGASRGRFAARPAGTFLRARSPPGCSARSLRRPNRRAPGRAPRARGPFHRDVHGRARPARAPHPAGDPDHRPVRLPARGRERRAAPHRHRAAW